MKLLTLNAVVVILVDCEGKHSILPTLYYIKALPKLSDRVYPSPELIDVKLKAATNTAGVFIKYPYAPVLATFFSTSMQLINWLFALSRTQQNISKILDFLNSMNSTFVNYASAMR